MAASRTPAEEEPLAQTAKTAWSALRETRRAVVGMQWTEAWRPELTGVQVAPDAQASVSLPVVRRAALTVPPVAVLKARQPEEKPETRVGEIATRNCSR